MRAATAYLALDGVHSPKHRPALVSLFTNPIGIRTDATNKTESGARTVETKPHGKHIRASATDAKDKRHRGRNERGATFNFNETTKAADDRTVSAHGYA
jgi:hypothetical protein